MPSFSIVERARHLPVQKNYHSNGKMTGERARTGHRSRFAPRTGSRAIDKKRDQALDLVSLMFQMVRVKGLEPSWGCPHTDLNRTRLPIPPHPHLLVDLGRKQEQMIQELPTRCKTEILRPQKKTTAFIGHTAKALATALCHTSERRGRSCRSLRVRAARLCGRCRQRTRSGCRPIQPRDGTG